jgi:rhodanese-related sulfurtransferase
MDNMKQKIFISLILSILIFLSPPTFSQSPATISVEDFEKGIHQNDMQLLDVRTQKEYSSGHLKNSFLADWADKKTFQERVQFLDKNKPVYTYCLSGGRSNAAATWLRQQGFKQVYNLGGGIVAWKSNNKPVEGAQTVKQISSDDFFKSLPKDKTVLVDIGAVWCPSCKKMEPVIKDLQKTKSNFFKVINVNGGEQDLLAKALDADSFPTFIIYKKGKEVWRKQGVVSKEELLHNLSKFGQ